VKNIDALLPGTSAMILDINTEYSNRGLFQPLNSTVFSMISRSGEARVHPVSKQAELLVKDAEEIRAFEV
jgi:hypothetical protein